MIHKQQNKTEHVRLAEQKVEIKKIITDEGYDFEKVKHEFGSDGSAEQNLILEEAWIKDGWRPGNTTKKYIERLEETKQLPQTFSEMKISLIKDSNKKFPLTEVNAEIVLNQLPPEGFVAIKVGGPGAEGGDVVCKNENGDIYKIEVKCTETFENFSKHLSHGAQEQATGNLVTFQVKNGTVVNDWLIRFWNVRAELIISSEPIDLIKLNKYKATDVIILDESGNILLPKQKVLK